MKWLGIILFLLLPGCEQYEGLPYKEYTIKEGRHASAQDIGLLSNYFLSYEVIFDESAIYMTRDPGNQADINKLFGFADCHSHHHNNSIRFGWRWNPDSMKIEILGYAYVNSTVHTQYITSVRINDPHIYTIIYEKDGYGLTVDSDIHVKMERGDVCSRGEYYLLFPYFGGDETAPHDITIYMRRHIRRLD